MTIVILTLAIGANSAIFSVIQAVLIHPAGVDAPERVAMLQTNYANLGVKFPVISVPDFADALSLKGQVETAALEQAIGYNLMQDGVTQPSGWERRYLALVLRSLARDRSSEGPSSKQKTILEPIRQRCSVMASGKACLVVTAMSSGAPSL